LSRHEFVVENLELGQDDRGLQCVQTAVYSQAHMVIATCLAMSRNLANGLGKQVVVGENRTAVSVAAQGLTRKEAGGCDGGQAAASASLVGCAETLRRIFDHR